MGSHGYYFVSDHRRRQIRIQDQHVIFTQFEVFASLVTTLGLRRSTASDAQDRRKPTHPMSPMIKQTNNLH